MAEQFLIIAQDPDGEILTTGYEARIVPRAGDHLALPEPGLQGWQDMEVIGIYLKPEGQITVELGGTTGWEPGSVKQLFAAVRDFNALRKAPTPEQFEELKDALPKPRADYLPD